MTTKPRRRNEKGNILFLILLAVVLFAALSYAVTQSLRGGGQGASNEINLVNSATVTAYPVGIRAAILRMVVGGTDATTLNFDPPSVFADADYTTAFQALGVFHPSGGGASFALIPPDVLAVPSTTARWFFNSDFEVPNIGTSVTGSALGNDVIAFAPGLTTDLCAKINTELGVDSVPTLSSTLTVAVQQNRLTDAGASNTYTASTTGTDHITDTGLVTSNKPFLCVTNGSSSTYYHVLVER